MPVSMTQTTTFEDPFVRAQAPGKGVCLVCVMLRADSPMILLSHWAAQAGSFGEPGGNCTYNRYVYSQKLEKKDRDKAKRDQIIV